MSPRDILRAATSAPHERLHHHAGFASVQDGTIGRADYCALLRRLYGFYVPFERAVGAKRVRTGWLARDLAYLSGADIAMFRRIRLCGEIPDYQSGAGRLGARYVVEGSALGGRMLARGLDRLLGDAAVDGRRFFVGHGAATGAAWRDYLDQLAAVGAADQAVMVGAAVEIFGVFETWLSGWDEMT